MRIPIILLFRNPFVCKSSIHYDTNIFAQCSLKTCAPAVKLCILLSPSPVFLPTKTKKKIIYCWHACPGRGIQAHLTALAWRRPKTNKCSRWLSQLRARHAALLRQKVPSVPSDLMWCGLLNSFAARSARESHFFLAFDGSQLENWLPAHKDIALEIIPRT